MTEFMISTRQAKNEDAVGPARFLTFDDATSPEQTLTQRRWLAQLRAAFPPKDTVRPSSPEPAGDILFLVHGFNENHQAARDFHMTCVGGLKAAGWWGQVVSYDWPSDGLVFAYLSDRSNARAAASTLVTSGIALLEQAQQADCWINVHVLAHSMGCFVTQQAFTWAYQDVPPDWRTGQVLMAAADVDQSVFSSDQFSAKMFSTHAARLTAYCNSYDKALAISNAKRLELAPRMGRAGLPNDAPQMMCEVDCTSFFHQAYPDLVDQLSPVTSH